MQGVDGLGGVQCDLHDARGGSGGDVDLGGAATSLQLTGHLTPAAAGAAGDHAAVVSDTALVWRRDG